MMEMRGEKTEDRSDLLPGHWGYGGEGNSRRGVDGRVGGHPLWVPLQPGFTTC